MPHASGVLLPTNGEVKAFALVDDTHAVVAFRAQGANDVHLVTTDERAAKPLTKTDRHCDYEGRSRADLYVGELGAQAKPKKIATVAHLHRCGIE